MTALKIGIATRTLRQPLRRALETAARLGAEGVEIDLRHELPLADCSQTALRQIRKLLDDLNLSLAAVAYPTRRGFADEADLDRRIQATMQAMTLGAQLGARVLVTGLGEIPVEDNPSFGRFIESLTALGAHGDRVGARLAAKTGGESGESLAALLAHFPSGVLGASFNPAALIEGGYSPLDAIAALQENILYLHAADAVRDLAERRVVEVPLGRGTADFPELLGALEEYDYRGWATVLRTDSPNLIEEIAAAVEYLRNVSGSHD